ncbi:MAG TPA: hypothetical protein VF829_03030 [Candidatus Paceibacterota bacterium]
MKVVIAGSASLQDEMQKWVRYWESKDHVILNYPQAIREDEFDSVYPNVHKEFFKDITDTDILFIANEKKHGIQGYIGPEVFAELAFGLAQRLVQGKNIRLILARMPAKEVASYDEIVLWKRLGWIDQILES